MIKILLTHQQNIIKIIILIKVIRRGVIIITHRLGSNLLFNATLLRNFSISFFFFFFEFE